MAQLEPVRRWSVGVHLLFDEDEVPLRVVVLTELAVDGGVVAAVDEGAVCHSVH